MNLTDAKIKEELIVKGLTGKRELKRRLMEMGITKGTKIYIDRLAPLADPINIKVRDYDLSLRKADAQYIKVERYKEGVGAKDENSFNR